MDHILQRAITNHRTPAADKLIVCVGKATDRQQVTVAAVTILIGSCGRRGAASCSRGLIAACLAGGIANLTKNVVKRARPAPEMLLRERQRPYRFGGAPSFPSAHTAAAVAFATCVSKQIPDRRAALHAVATLIGYSRLHLGTHYGTDVIGGALIGAAVGRGVVRQSTDSQKA